MSGATLPPGGEYGHPTKPELDNSEKAASTHIELVNEDDHVRAAARGQVATDRYGELICHCHLYLG